jgi:murein DD-endopeptidase MepM/ murein hydrolase activator NlpD
MPSTSKHTISGLVTALALSVLIVPGALAGGGGGVTPGGDDGSGDGGGGKYLFPLPAPHQYGDGFGAGRNHKGQDVFSRCGRKLIAVESGKVQTSAYHSAAGNYIVLDVDGSGKDFAYMHLQEKAIPREGSRVARGEKIGNVGDTGNASGCHLHFEMWTSPGYYQGGEPSPNVTRALKSWDKYS